MQNLMCGILEGKEKYYFNFDKSSNIIIIQPVEMGRYASMFSEIEFQKHPEFKNIIEMEGENNLHQYVKFFNLKFQSIGRGCFRAWVPGYIIGENNALSIIPKPYNIKEMVFSGKAIDLFFSPKITLRYENNSLNQEQSIITKCNDEQIEEIKYKNMKIQFIPSFSTTGIQEPNKVLSVKTFLKIIFEEPLSMQNIIDNYIMIEKILSLVNFRQNVDFDKITLGQYENIESFDGIKKEEKITFDLIINLSKEERDLPSVNINGALFDDIKEYLPNIIDNLLEDEFILLSFPLHSKEEFIVTTDNYIRVSSAFESEFSKKFPNFKSKIKDNFKIAKDNVVNYISKRAKDSEKFSSKIREYFKDIKHEIEMMDGRLEEKLKYALNKYKYVLEKEFEFYSRKYPNLKIKSQNLANAFASKRNHLSHGNLMEKFTDIEMIAYIFIRKVNYAILLDRSGVSKEKIIQIMEKVF